MPTSRFAFLALLAALVATLCFPLAATANATQALEMSDRVGTLEEGKLADLIAVDGNPLEGLPALDNLEAVVQGREVVSTD